MSDTRLYQHATREVTGLNHFKSGPVKEEKKISTKPFHSRLLNTGTMKPGFHGHTLNLYVKPDTLQSDDWTD